MFPNTELERELYVFPCCLFWVESTLICKFLLVFPLYMSLHIIIVIFDCFLRSAGNFLMNAGYLLAMCEILNFLTSYIGGFFLCQADPSWGARAAERVFCQVSPRCGWHQGQGGGKCVQQPVRSGLLLGWGFSSLRQLTMKDDACERPQASWPGSVKAFACLGHTNTEHQCSLLLVQATQFRKNLQRLNQFCLGLFEPVYLALVFRAKWIWTPML